MTKCLRCGKDTRGHKCVICREKDKTTYQCECGETFYVSTARRFLKDLKKW